MDKVCQQLPPEEVYKQFERASKLLLHPKDVPDIKLMDLDRVINHEGKKESRRNDNITLCELTEEPNSHGKVKKSINREGKKESRRNDNITLCELTEELNPHGKVEKSITTLFATNIGYAVMKEQSVDRRKSEESINRPREDTHTEGNEHWTDTGRSTYPNVYSEKSLNHLGDVGSWVVFPCEGRAVICDKQWKQTIPKYRAIKAKNHLFVTCTTAHLKGMCRV